MRIPHFPLPPSLSSDDVAVVDEVQMLADNMRGGAWTQAILGKHIVEEEEEEVGREGGGGREEEGGSGGGRGGGGAEMIGCCIEETREREKG